MTSSRFPLLSYYSRNEVIDGEEPLIPYTIDSFTGGIVPKEQSNCWITQVFTLDLSLTERTELNSTELWIATSDSHRLFLPYPSHHGDIDITKIQKGRPFERRITFSLR